MNWKGFGRRLSWPNDICLVRLRESRPRFELSTFRSITAILTCSVCYEHKTIIPKLTQHKHHITQSKIIFICISLYIYRQRAFQLQVIGLNDI
jgi:hypothetical protein